MQADGWQDFHSKFMQLANEEEGIERAAPKDRLLRAHCDYHKHPGIWHEKGKPDQGFFCLLKAPETGVWIVSDGVNENFQERVRTLAVRAGRALGCPEGTDPEDFWLHRLYLDLRQNNSDQLFAASEQGGVVLRLCVASATFCARLERRALEQSEPNEQARKDAIDIGHAIGAKNEPTTTLPPTWNELRKRNSITQREAAVYLGRDTKTIRRLVKAKKLRQSEKKRIICDEHLRNQIRKLHGPHVLP